MRSSGYPYKPVWMVLLTTLRDWTVRGWWLAITWALLASAAAADPGSVPSGQTGNDAEASLWHYGAYLDVGYVVNANFPENHLWRNRATAARHNEFAPNMALAYVRKDTTESSRWGMELGVQGGYDSERFAFLQGEREVGGADTLR
ncbi:MAG: porin, partial [Nitrospira sp.]|nr:porin [Nitrospira sp.]